MKISEHARIIFNKNGSIVVRQAFQSRHDRVFHDIIVTDSEHEFQKKDWVGCETILLNKIWKVYLKCIQDIQGKPGMKIPNFAPESARIVYHKNPATFDTKKTRLFINSSGSALSPTGGYQIGHWGEINTELDILRAFLLEPHEKVLPPKPEPVVASKEPKASKPKTTTASMATEPAKKPADPVEPAILAPAGVPGAPPRPAVTPPPVSPLDPSEDDPEVPVTLPQPSRISLPPVGGGSKNSNVDDEKRRSVRRGHFNAVSESLAGSGFNPSALKEELL